MVTVSLSIPQLFSFSILTKWRVTENRKISFGFATTSVISLGVWFVLGGRCRKVREIQCYKLPLVLQITLISSLLLLQKILVRYLEEGKAEFNVSAIP